MIGHLSIEANGVIIERNSIDKSICMISIEGGSYQMHHSDLIRIIKTGKLYLDILSGD